MIVQVKNEKLVIMALYRSPLDCNVVAFIVFKKGFHQRIKRTKQSASSLNKIRLRKSGTTAIVLDPFDESSALLDDCFDELPNQTENKSLESC
ncbi:hypothetical protein TNCV_2323271 [Trichonephila clavipes]|nr:hypothetical protein TNCV_2323271 [Trichonephila clavipes]